MILKESNNKDIFKSWEAIKKNEGARVFLPWNRRSQKVTITFKYKNDYEEDAARLFFHFY